MNYTNFDQVGGFPLETETLSKMQENYSIFQAFGEIVGEKSIIKGCKQVGNTIGDGVIYWDGELLPFVGGGIQSKIVIIEEITTAEFEDGDVKPTYYKRYATFGTGTEAVLWTEFKRAYPLTSALYIDKVDMFAGDIDNIPAGWYLCNGENGTADLRGRFIVGYNPDDDDYNDISTSQTLGGKKEVTLIEAQMPIHNHTGSTNSAGSHKHNYTASSSQWASEPRSGNAHLRALPPSSKETNSAGDHTHTLNINDKGGDEAHENRPPFYTLAYIQFKGI